MAAAIRLANDLVDTATAATLAPTSTRSITMPARLAISVFRELCGRSPADVEIALNRIVREALNNVVKHAHAVRIELRHTQSNIECTVRDDGVGSEALRKGVAVGMGLIGIRERLSAIGGSLRIISVPRRGTTLVVAIPLGDGYAVTRTARR